MNSALKVLLTLILPCLFSVAAFAACDHYSSCKSTCSGDSGCYSKCVDKACRHDCNPDPVDPWKCYRFCYSGNNQRDCQDQSRSTLFHSSQAPKKCN